MDEELRTLLVKLADSIDGFSARLDTLENRGNQLFDEYDKAQKKFDHDTKRKDWDAKYSEKLGPYVDKAKAIKGDDFDLMEESMNEYYSENGVDSDAYVQCLIDTMEEKFKNIADRLTGNAEADKAEVEKAADEAVEQAAEEKAETEPQPEAEVTITAEAEPKAEAEKAEENIVSDEATKEAVTDATTESKSESETEKKEDVDKAEDKVDDKKDELDEFTKELEAEKNKLDQKHVGN